MSICELCGRDTESLYHITEQVVLDMIRREHPEWVGDNGACPRCIGYYEGLADVVRVEEKKPRRI
jgi:hypothetical protein